MDGGGDYGTDFFPQLTAISVDGGDGGGGGANGSMLDGGDMMGYPNTDIAKDEIIMKLRSQNVKLRQKLKELNSALDAALEKA